jgi:hypothetical protein
MLVFACFVFYGQTTVRAQNGQHFEIREAGIVKCSDGVHFCVNSGPPDNIDDTWSVAAYDSKRDLLVMERAKP